MELKITIMNIKNIQDALKSLWNDCYLGFATMFWGIIMLVSLPLFSSWGVVAICFFFWVGSAWFTVIGCFIVPFIDLKLRKVL